MTKVLVCRMCLAGRLPKHVKCVGGCGGGREERGHSARHFG